MTSPISKRSNFLRIVRLFDFTTILGVFFLALVQAAPITTTHQPGPDTPLSSLNLSSFITSNAPNTMPKSVAILPPGSQNCFPGLMVNGATGAITSGNWVGSDCPATSALSTTSSGLSNISTTTTYHTGPFHFGIRILGRVLHKLERTSLSFLKGLGLGAVHVIDGTYTTIRHPNQTLHGIIIAIEHPGITAEVMRDHIVTNFNRNPAEFLGETVSSFLLPEIAGNCALMLTNVGAMTVLHISVARDTASALADATEVALEVAHNTHEISEYGISDRKVLNDRHAQRADPVSSSEPVQRDLNLNFPPSRKTWRDWYRGLLFRERQLVPEGTRVIVTPPVPLVRMSKAHELLYTYEYPTI